MEQMSGWSMRHCPDCRCSADEVIPAAAKACAAKQTADDAPPDGGETQTACPRTGDDTWESPPSTRLKHRALPTAPFKLVTVGGSASAVKQNYGFYVAEELSRRLGGSLASSNASVVSRNPSAGATGSDWASMMLDSLVDADADMIIWEFEINDWHLHDLKSMTRAAYHVAVVRLFLERAAWLFPNASIGMVFLWQQNSGLCSWWPPHPRPQRITKDGWEDQGCWPDCPLTDQYVDRNPCAMVGE